MIPYIEMRKTKGWIWELGVVFWQCWIWDTNKASKWICQIAMCLKFGWCGLWRYKLGNFHCVGDTYLKPGDEMRLLENK